MSLLVLWAVISVVVCDVVCRAIHNSKEIES